MKVAITHDYLNQFGGAERVLTSMHELWPEAPIFTSLYEEQQMREWGFNDEGWDIKTSFMQKIPGFLYKNLPRFYFTFLYPLAFRSFNLEKYDLVISTSSYAAKDIKKSPEQIHIAYIHTPPRFLYGLDQETNVAAMKRFERALAGIWKIYLRKRDQKSARGVDFFIANSRTVQDRIKKIYHQNSVVIYPPVNVARFAGESRDEGFYLVVSRLGEYKKVDLVVKAFNELGLSLKIVGRGPQLEYLKSIAKPNIEFLGRVSDDKVRDLMLTCTALVFATEEDFGITPVEAMAAGKPVIAYGKGGASESIIQGQTGFLFPEQSVAEIINAVNESKKFLYSPQVCRSRAREFDEDRFKKSLEGFVNQVTSGKIS